MEIIVILSIGLITGKKFVVSKKNSYQEQIGRLVSYAKGLGLSVFFREAKREIKAAAEWTLDGTELIIYQHKRQTKIQTILCLIHELAHHIDFIHRKDRSYDHKFAEALDKTDKKSRKLVYDNELAGTKWWETVYKETNLTFPIRRMHLEKEYDMFYYETFWKTGKYPTIKEAKAFRKTLRQKYNYK